MIAEQKPASSTEATCTVVVPCRLGLHLRVAALVVTMSRNFQSEITLIAGQRRVDAKSIFGMLRLAAVRGQQLSLVARGPDAQRAVQVLAELFESKGVLCKEDMAAEAERPRVRHSAPTSMVGASEVTDGHA